MMRQHPLVDRLTDAFFAVDEGWRFTYLNDRAEAMLDRPREELLGRVIWDEFPETVETQFPDGFYEAMERQEPVSFEVYHTPMETWYEVRAYPSADGISVFFHDVTERTRRRKELARYETVVEAAHDGVVAIDPDNEISFVNDAFVRSVGCTREDLLGEHVDVLTDVADLDPEQLRELGHGLDTLRAGNARVRQVEMTYTAADGTERACEVRLVPLEDGTGGVGGVIRDVTERREYERVVDRLHDVSRQLFGARDTLEICSIVVHATSEILEFPLTGVWLMDDEMGYLDPVAGSAGAYDELGGLPRFGEGEGLAWDAYQEGEQRYYEDLREVEGVYNPDTPIRSEMIVPLGQHGVVVTASLEPDAFDDTDIDLASTLCANAEAALERAERERVLRERKQVLGRQSERLDAVSAVLSRDVEAHLEDAAAALDADDPAAADVESALDLLGDALEFAGGNPTVGPRSTVDLSTAVAAAADAATPETDLRVSLAADASLRADPDRLQRLFSALFEAAAVRADDHVAVEVELLETGRGLAIVDDGPGLPVAAPEAFRVGYEAAADTAGLGLPIAREIAEAHGWSISVDEDYAGGTRVLVEGIATLEPGG